MAASKAWFSGRDLALRSIAKRTLQRIPEPVKAPLRDSKLFQALRTPWHAAKLARTTRRLDLCAAQFAHMLHLSGARLEGASCLELGAGWVLTHALVCHLLGASRVTAVDVESVARPALIEQAVRTASPAVVRDLLAPFSTHADVRARLDRLRSIRRFDHAVLAELGIDYVAPFDLARQKLQRRFDFIYSLSVLEHVPVEDVPALLSNLTAQLAPDGMMLHAIHLEDHLDFAKAPFAFLAERAAPFAPAEQNQRGNRLRASSWCEFFAAQPGLSHRILWSWQRRDCPLPGALAPEVRYVDDEDLRTSHLGVLVRSQPALG
jgi:hypothetical protein